MAAKRKSGLASRKIKVSNPDKVMYPAGKFTKARVIQYYVGIASVLLNHLKDRPITLKRFPDGVFGQAFYEKNAPGFTPEWIRTFPVPRSDSSLAPINYILINDVETLAWAANLASLELHPFLHRVPNISRPTHLVFDLDPGEGTDILGCAEVAFLLSELLQKLSLTAFPKVSGSKGIQLYVPLNRPVNYEVTQPFAQALAELMARRHPDRVVSQMAKALRHGKVFIDWSQNAEHKTTVSPYSLRAKNEHPYVSLPVSWEELKRAQRKGSAGSLFWEADAALARVKKVGDLFAPVLTLKQELPSEVASIGDIDGAKPKKSLSAYEEKRNFTRTPEPWGKRLPGRSAQGSRRRFVVQKHAASHLHYDFRLEMRDVLKSWAVPKGVPLKKGEVVSAFATEDHPLDYLEFEGTIPQGEYGGGTVMVWDIGTYDIVDGNYWKGRLVIFLTGSKLKGEWTLEKKDEANGKARWLLIKTGGSTRLAKASADRSAVSDRTMEQIAGDNDAVWNSNRRAGTKTTPKLRKAAALEPAPESAKKKMGDMPEFVIPMKPSAVRALPEGEEWLYEIKWDGYRALAMKSGADVKLRSMKNHNLGADFPQLLNAVSSIRADTALVDGEIVALDDRGTPSFQMLQNRRSLGRHWHIVYYAFDLLHLDGKDLANTPLETRREKLKAVVQGSGLRFSGELSGTAKEVLKIVADRGLEGVMAKRRDSKYRAGIRSESWVKVKLDASQEFVIGGFNADGKTFQSILAGYYEEKELLFAGKVRQGFTPAVRRELFKVMKPLIAKSCPFSNLPISRKSHFGEGITEEDMKKLVWLKPVLVARCSFREWTDYGLLRHATYMGLRDDKDAADVGREEIAVPPR